MLNDPLVTPPLPPRAPPAFQVGNRTADFGAFATSQAMSFDPHTAWFWGGRGSSSYPLHRDLVDADAFFTVFTVRPQLVLNGAI